MKEFVEIFKLCFFYCFGFRFGKLKVFEWVDIVKLVKYKEFVFYDENWFYM